MLVLVSSLQSIKLPLSPVKILYLFTLVCFLGNKARERGFESYRCSGQGLSRGLKKDKASVYSEAQRGKQSHKSTHCSGRCQPVHCRPWTQSYWAQNNHQWTCQGHLLEKKMTKILKRKKNQKLKAYYYICMKKGPFERQKRFPLIFKINCKRKGWMLREAVICFLKSNVLYVSRMR